MIEIIKDQYAVTSDSACVTVYARHTNKKTGEHSWRAEYFYSDYKQALAGILNRKIQSDAREFKDFSDLIQTIRECEKAILTAIETKLSGKEVRFNYDIPIS